MNYNLKTLVEGYDAHAYTLPAAILEARHAVDTLDATWPDKPTDPVDARYSLAADMAAAAGKGEPLPGTDTYLDAIRAHHDWTALTEALATAREQASNHLDGLLTTDADTVITEHLAPAMADMQTQLAGIAKLLPEDVSDRQMASPVTTAKARAAWRQLDDLALRYSLIRQAQHTCYRMSGGDGDDGGQWAAVEDLLAVWPRWRQRNNGIGAHEAPWPADPRSFLLWMQHRGATFAVLTRTEREQRWQDMYGAEVEEHRQTAARARNLGGLVA